MRGDRFWVATMFHASGIQVGPVVRISGTILDKTHPGAGLTWEVLLAEGASEGVRGKKRKVGGSLENRSFTPAVTHAQRDV